MLAFLIPILPILVLTAVAIVLIGAHQWRRTHARGAFGQDHPRSIFETRRAGQA